VPAVLSRSRLRSEGSSQDSNSISVSSGGIDTASSGTTSPPFAIAIEDYAHRLTTHIPQRWCNLDVPDSPCGAVNRYFTWYNEALQWFRLNEALGKLGALRSSRRSIWHIGVTRRLLTRKRSSWKACHSLACNLNIRVLRERILQVSYVSFASFLANFQAVYARDLLRRDPFDACNSRIRRISFPRDRS